MKNCPIIIVVALLSIIFSPHEIAFAEIDDTPETAFITEGITCKNSSGKTIFSSDSYGFTRYLVKHPEIFAGDRLFFSTQNNRSTGITRGVDHIILNGYNFYYDVEATATIFLESNSIEIHEVSDFGPKDRYTLNCHELLGHL